MNCLSEILAWNMLQKQIIKINIINSDCFDVIIIIYYWMIVIFFILNGRSIVTLVNVGCIDWVWNWSCQKMKLCNYNNTS